ncbi:MAG: hypothetical protein WA952_21125 [Lewinella sp.]
MRLLCFVSLLFDHPLPGQATVLFFTWEGSDPGVSDTGPDDAFIGNRVVTNLRLDGNTKGLSVSQSETREINLVIADDLIFDIKAIDISFDYQRDEEAYAVLSRNNFYLCRNGLNVKYRVSDGTGGITWVTSPS